MNQEQQIEISLEQANYSMELWQSYQRLLKNEDFKKLILDSFLEKEAVRLVRLKTDPSMLDATSKEQLEQALIGISYLTQYFRSIQQLGIMAAQSIQELEETRDSLYEEESIDAEVVN